MQVKKAAARLLPWYAHRCYTMIVAAATRPFLDIPLSPSGHITLPFINYLRFGPQIKADKNKFVCHGKLQYNEKFSLPPAASLPGLPARA